MLYTLENTTKIGKPIKVFDGEGNHIPKALSVDTETGKVTKFKTNEDGTILVVNEETMETVEETITVPLPIRIEFLETGEAVNG